VSALYLPSELELNIFYLDHDPRVAARAHCDRHVVKMILETAQLLSAAWHVLAPAAISTSIGSTDPAFPLGAWKRATDAGLRHGTSYYLGNQRIYAPTHLNHPCAVWVRESVHHYDWLYRLGGHLLDEYMHRYKRRHATEPVLRTLEYGPSGLPAAPATEPPTAMPAEYVVADATGDVDAVASYRAYYRGEKRPLLVYTRRGAPAWCRDIATCRSVE
jgi:hypothetical protein